MSGYTEKEAEAVSLLKNRTERRKYGEEWMWYKGNV
jgi:hypothetical protein